MRLSALRAGSSVCRVTVNQTNPKAPIVTGLCTRYCAPRRALLERRNQEVASESPDAGDHQSVSPICTRHHERTLAGMIASVSSAMFLIV